MLGLTQEILPRRVSAGCRYSRQSKYDVGGGQPIMKASALRSSILPCHAEGTVEDGGFGGRRVGAPNASCKNQLVSEVLWKAIKRPVE
jgi:hypothetical protein